MTSEEILEQLGLIASLMEINDENTFKSDAYRRAVYNLERNGKDLFQLADDEIAKLDGVGKSIAVSIVQIKRNGLCDELLRLRGIIPAGVIEMLTISGIGPKKIRAIWKELLIENKSDLLQACKEGRVAQQKGFGEKTQKAIEANLMFELGQAGKLRLDQAIIASSALLEDFKVLFSDIALSGSVYSKQEIIEELEFIVGSDNSLEVHEKLDKVPSLSKESRISSPFIWRGVLKGLGTKVHVITVPSSRIVSEKYIYAAAEAHLSEKVLESSTMLDYLKSNSFETEEAIFEKLGISYIVPEAREGLGEWQLAKKLELPKLIDYQDIKGPLHNHSTWSDGKHTLEEMAQYCLSQGWEYLGISDHSQSAIYANGLYPERVLSQHKEIAAINSKMSGFKIFKGIESDILGDGSLDYDSDILKEFDYIVASVHSGLSMDESKATARLIKAVENPYTTILGHPTGRLLLKRQGYPIDFYRVIDACAANAVAIEINSNPWRLDLSWKYIKYALDKGVKIAICPDAHENAGFADMQYGVWMGRKALLTKENCINCMSTAELLAYFNSKK